MAKIGIMGGTFDPVHNGHLLLGRQAYKEYGLDEVWYMPSGTPPHKTDHQITSARDRGAMVSPATGEYPYFRLSDFEIRRKGKTYTAETLGLLAEEYPQNRFYFIVGADSLYQIESWYHPEAVLAGTVLLAACREYPQAPRSIESQRDYLMARYQADIRLLHCDEIDISSGELRRMCARGTKIYKYVPPKVETYIREHHLYTSGQESVQS